ncbi:MAG: phosphoenolpyruvate--protein phosphotransferase [Pseudomonadota bacterium]
MSAGAYHRDGGAQPRVLLRRIREALAGAGDGAERLHKIVHLIATNMVAEVCSIYLLDRSGALVLRATEGLNPESVRQAQLPIGAGLVGRIAATGEPINTDDAANTPGFRFIPGTGEEIYRSFLGAPIRRLGRTLGVLVVQNKAARRYDEEEVEALELIATVIAEMTDAGALFTEADQAEPAPRGPVMLRGVAAAEGVAIGRVVLHEPKIVLHNPIADDAEKERARLHDAIEAVRGEIDRLISGEGLAAGRAAAGLLEPGEHRDVLEAFRLFAHDAGWLRRLEAAVEGGLSAEAAVEKVQSEARARLEKTADPYLRDRLSDLDDLANRMLRELLGVAPPSPEDLPEDAILLARALGPGELLDYGRGRLKGVVLEEGSAGGHAAIVARALEIPLVTGVKGVSYEAETDEPIIVDGDVGRALLRPDGSVSAAYREKLTLRAQEAALFRTLRDQPAITRDGVRMTLFMNAGLLTDLPSIEESGAEGVGLYRTELQYLVTTRAPRRDAQTRLYRRVLEAAGDKPVVFRTLDMGGDKQLPFLKGGAEENPALGWRAIRIALDRPLLFRMQLQALIRAAEGRAISVMFPMLASAEEFHRAKELIEIEKLRHIAEGRQPPTAMRVGAMLETPALAFAPDSFYEEADFVSVGGNDLMQFFFAADRGNERVRARYDALDGAFLRMLRLIVTRCASADTPLSFCGEAAGRPLEAIALAALGFRTLSMRPAGIGPVKRALRSVDLGAVSSSLDEILASPAASARPGLIAVCEAAGAPL